VTVIDNILNALQQQNMTSEEIHTQIGGKRTTVKTELSKMRRMGLVSQTDTHYTITKLGLLQALKASKDVSVRSYNLGIASRDNLYKQLPNRQIFTTADIYRDVLRTEKTEALKSQVKYSLQHLLKERKIKRVSPIDQPTAKLVQYVKGVEEDEWICSVCQQILPANYFDVINYGMPGAKCHACRTDAEFVHAEPVSVMDFITATDIEDPGLHAMEAVQMAMEQVSNGSLKFIEEQVGMISKSLGKIHWMGEHIASIDKSMQEMVKINKATHDLFVQLATKKQ